MIKDADLRLLPKPALLIGGRRITDASGGVHRHVYAATGKATGEVPLAGAEEINTAIAVARDAAPGWANMAVNQRRDLLLRLGQLIREEADALAGMSVIDNSIPISTAEGGPLVAADTFLYFAGWTDKIGGDVITTWPASALDYTLDEPYGVVAVIIPWNGPIYALGMVLAPALAAGNVVVVKPPELAPYSAIRLGELCLQAGIPPGVVNIVPGGPAAGQALTSHAGVDKIHFTGSGATARHILVAAAQKMIPVQLELGGKAAQIVFADADLDVLLPYAIGGALNNSGQGCCNPTRLLVQASIYDDVLERIAAFMPRITVGDPFDRSTMVGPVVDDRAVTRIMGMIERSHAGGARLIAGGARLGGEMAGGYFIAPTVFADVAPTSELSRCEVFGPVQAVMKFETEEEAIQLANDTEFGLGGYIWTQNLKRAHLVAKQMTTGNIWINGFPGLPIAAPFGGVKQSGYGRLGGLAGLREFLRPKNIWVAL